MRAAFPRSRRQQGGKHTFFRANLEAVRILANINPTGSLPGLTTTHSEDFLGLQNGFGASLWPDSLAPRLCS